MGKLESHKYTNNLQSVFFSNQDTGYAVGWNGEIIKTTDCGSTWTSQNSVTMTGNLEVLFTDDVNGYIVGGEPGSPIIQKTVNGGASWEDVSPLVTEALVAIHFPSNDIGYAVGTNGTVVKTENGGIVLATKELERVNDLTVFPNPTSKTLTILSTQNESIEGVKIYDVNGRLIKEMQPNELNPTLDFTSLEANIYYLELVSGERRTIKKIVKK